MGHFDQMQVCRNGHQITDSARSAPEFRRNFCAECGAATIDQCDDCGAEIKGNYNVKSVIAITGPTPVPHYCDNCGKPYPWQQSAIENLEALFEEGGLSKADIEKLRETLPDVLRDTPKSESASIKFGRILKKLGKPVYDIAITVISDIASETAKKTLGL